jgi:hypothetical protein
MTDLTTVHLALIIGLVAYPLLPVVAIVLTLRDGSITAGEKTGWAVALLAFPLLGFLAWLAYRAYLLARTIDRIEKNK